MTSNNNQGCTNRNSSSRRHNHRSSNKQKDQSSSSNDIMSPTPYTTTSSQSPPTKPNRLTATKSQAAETSSPSDSITNDDLEAMKAMIGDIKKDPSLLYRLSNLSGSPSDKQHHHHGGGAPPTNMTANNNNRGPSAAAAPSAGGGGVMTNSSPRNSGAASPSFRGSFTLMDDTTEVSSIGMMSSDDYNSYLHPNTTGGMMMMGGNNIHHSNEFANACVAGVVSNNNNNNATPSKQGMNTNEQQGRGTMSPTVMMTSPNQSRTNRDAEIALRMQSLRAMRDWNKQQQQQVQQAQQQGSGGGGRKGSPTNIANGGNGGGSASVAAAAAVTSPSSNSGNRGESTNDYDDHSSQQQQQTQSLPPPIQSPPPPTDTKTSSSSRRREGKSSSSNSNGGGGGGSKSSKSRSRRKDSTNSHRNVDKNHSNSNGDDRRSSRNDQEEDSSSQVVDDMYNDPNDMMSELYAPQRRNHHGDGGEGMENFPQSLEEQLDQQQHELSERTLRRISEATIETSTTNLTTASSGFVRKGSGKQQHGGGGVGSPRGNGRGTSKRGGGGGRPSLGQRSASHGSYISGSQSVQDGHYHQRQQQQQQYQHQQQPNPSSPSSTKYGRRNTHDPPSPSKHSSLHETTSPYSRRNTTHNDESFSSPSKHSFHEFSTTSDRRRNTAASEQGMYSRSYSYSDDHRIHGGVYDGRLQQHPHQQHSNPPQDYHQTRSQSFSVNDQNNYQCDHSGSSDDRSYQVHQLAKLYARGGTPEKNNSDGRGDATNHSVDEHSVPSSRVSSPSYEEEGRHHHHHNNHHQHHSQQQSLSNRKGRRQQRFSMNDGMIDDKSTNQYDTPQKHSASDNNLEVSAKAKSKSMIITHRDAAESISPRRKSKKSSKKSSSRGGSDEKKKSKRSSKSKVQDVPSSESKDSLNPVSPTSESMRLSLQSSESSGLVFESRASSPGKKSSFHGRIRRFTRQASTDLSTSSSGVRDRLSNPLRSLKSPSKDRASPQSGLSGYQDDPSEPVRRPTLDSTNASDHESPQKQRKNKLMSRLVSSPTQLENCGSISIADDDDDQAVSTGIELALTTGDVPRLCDAKGRCLFHPHIRLQKPKLFGGWKILFKHCPDCAVEHMRATQDKMAEKKKKKRRERKSDEKKRSDEKKKSDPIIEMNVGDDDFTPKKSKKKKRKPRDDGEKKEEPQQEPLALPSPAPPREEDDQTEVSDAITNYDPPYQESRAIVEHKPPRSKKVNGLPWSDYNGQSGRYTGEVNEQYLPHGRGEMVYDEGIVSAGIWYNGVLDTEEPVSMDGYVPNRLSNYEIGDKGSDEDMIIASKRETAAAVAQLRVNDAAFVRRSDGSWTYAVMKDQVDDGRNRSIRFKVNTRGSTKSFPPSQWGTYIRCINSRTEINANRRSDAQPKRSALGLGEYLDSNNRRSAQPSGHSSHSLAGNFTGYSGDISVSSTHSAPVLDRNRSNDNLTTAKMRIKSRSRSRGRKNVTTLPLLFSSSMSVSEEAEDDTSDEWETASGSGYRLRGIDP